MNMCAKFLTAAVFFCSAVSANAGLMQRIDFILGMDPTADPVQTAFITFPQQAGCISGTSFFLPPFDCETDLGIPDTNVPGDIGITGTLGDGEFNVGAWRINDDWLLEAAGFSFTEGGFEIAVFGSMPFPGGTVLVPPGSPVAAVGGWLAENIEDGGRFGGVALVTPVPSPPILFLFGAGLLALRISRSGLS